MITIMRVPDGHKDLTYESGMTVNDAIEMADWELKDNEEVRLNGRPVNGNGLDTELRDNDAVLIVKNISGN